MTVRPRQWLFAYLGAMLAMLVIDGIWLGVLMADTYRDWLGEMMLDQPRWTPAALFYLLYTTGLVVFAVLPALRSNRLRQAALLGGLLGLVAYGTYDLSNLATLKQWSVTLTVVDVLWGGVLSALASCAGYLAARRG
ncbi:DUF2177 family protein [Massilia sp. CF038]|uniref:DUF2177 family protein n=1 Tax=Massilia sp. CF038 TaxID=1881045 RepID=UPI00092235E7|nr:DUF2177 family protein [Massilia sp. CF038]SHH55911.1 Uncharacterized membrane protein [Massilia sp. CF038]